MAATASFNNATKIITVASDGLPRPVSFGTFPNENNPTSVGAVVKEMKNEFGTYPDIVQKLETPHLPDEEEPEPIDEDELFKDAMRAKAEADKQQFLNNNASKKK